MARIDFTKKKILIDLAGNCFHFYDRSFYPFLTSCGVSNVIIKKYPRGTYTKYEIMENILNELENSDQIDVIKNITSAFYKMNKAVDDDYLKKESPNKSNKSKELLNEFRELVGNDPIEQEIKKRESDVNKQKYQQKIADHKLKKEKLSELNNSFKKMLKSTNPQQRGFDFEKLFFEILELEQFQCTRPYRHNNEQLDGWFNYEKFDYIVEIKWEKGEAKQELFSIFDGKIRGKAQSTRGFFISVNGFCSNAINKYSGDAPRILLMDGSELAMILEERISFYDCLKSKIDAFVRKGEIFYKTNF